VKEEHRVGAALFWMMFLQWGILTVNFRAVAQGSYFWVGLADILTAALGFTILKKVQEAKTWFEMACYTVGGTLGSQVALVLCLHYLK